LSRKISLKLIRLPPALVSVKPYRPDRRVREPVPLPPVHLSQLAVPEAVFPEPGGAARVSPALSVEELLQPSELSRSGWAPGAAAEVAVEKASVRVPWRPIPLRWRRGEDRNRQCHLRLSLRK
jgi:hypothetical protein